VRPGRFELRDLPRPAERFAGNLLFPQAEFFARCRLKMMRFSARSSSSAACPIRL
jgi:hypothetical protein